MPDLNNSLKRKKGRPKLSSQQKFFDNIYPEPNTGCWFWAGSIDHDGYGKICHDNKAMFAHRFSYQYFKGPITDGLLVCHHCDNRSCVNPDHLFMGSYKDNIQDCIKKGRFTVSKSKQNRKLSDEKVADILYHYLKGVKQKELAKRYNVTPQTISAVITGKSWL